MQDDQFHSLALIRRETLPGSTHATPGTGLLFLREEELRTAQDMISLAMRDLNAAPDAILAELGYGRAHHRCMHWVARRPGLKVGELLAVLDITKQSLGRVLGPMLEDGYVAQVRGQQDRRERLLTLTEKGQALERRLYESQRERLIVAYREAGGPAVEGCKCVLRGLMHKQGRDYVDGLEHRVQRAPRAGR
jgi:DNA-binding MarR family transcriptional regulator